MLFREQKLPWERCGSAGRCGWNQPRPCQTGRGSPGPLLAPGTPQPRPPARALLERTLGPVLPTAANKTPPLRVGGNGELVFTPRAPRVHPCHGSLHYRIADPQATQDTNKERRVSLQGESCRFNLRAVREQGSDRISAALAYAACA